MLNEVQQQKQLAEAAAAAIASGEWDLATLIIIIKGKTLRSACTVL